MGKINFQSFFFLMKIKEYSDDYFKEAISFAKKAGVNVVGIGTEGNPNYIQHVLGMTRSPERF